MRDTWLSCLWQLAEGYAHEGENAAAVACTSVGPDAHASNEAVFQKVIHCYISLAIALPPFVTMSCFERVCATTSSWSPRIKPGQLVEGLISLLRLAELYSRGLERSPNLDSSPPF